MTVPVDAYGRALTTDRAPRCWRCNRMLALFVTRPWRIACGRCKSINQQGVTGGDPVEEAPPASGS